MQITFDKTLIETGNWQVIFQTPEGLDYARETLPGDTPVETVKEWTAEKIKWITWVNSARIEKW